MHSYILTGWLIRCCVIFHFDDCIPSVFLRRVKSRALLLKIVFLNGWLHLFYPQFRKVSFRFKICILIAILINYLIQGSSFYFLLIFMLRFWKYFLRKYYIMKVDSGTVGFNLKHCNNLYLFWYWASSRCV